MQLLSGVKAPRYLDLPLSEMSPWSMEAVKNTDEN